LQLTILLFCNRCALFFSAPVQLGHIFSFLKQEDESLGHPTNSRNFFNSAKFIRSAPSVLQQITSQVLLLREGATPWHPHGPPGRKICHPPGALLHILEIEGHDNPIDSMRLMLLLKNSSKDPSVALKDVQTLVFRVRLICEGCARVRCNADVASRL
jgi:hypothetical protein